MQDTPWKNILELILMTNASDFRVLAAKTVIGGPTELLLRRQHSETWKGKIAKI